MANPNAQPHEPPPAADDDAAAPAAGAAGPAGSAKFFKLPDFWPSTSAAWFGVAESQFALRGVTSQRDRFGLVAAILPEESARKVAHLLINPTDSCYDDLKKALLSHHVLTDFQRAERLFNMDNLGARRPMDLLAEMLELVQPGEEKTRLFAMLFLRRLPPAVRVQLTEDSLDDLRALAEKADRCADSLSKMQLERHLVAAASTPSDTESNAGDDVLVAAVSGQSTGSRRFQKKQSTKKGSRQSYSQPTAAAGGQKFPTGLQSSAGFCYYHTRFGRNSHKCREPCSWQEN